MVGDHAVTNRSVERNVAMVLTGLAVEDLLRIGRELELPVVVWSRGEPAAATYPARMDVPINLDALRQVLRRHGVCFALLFGSHARGTADDRSDVDIAVWAPTPVDLWSLSGELDDIVDVVDLQRAPDGLAGRIALHGEVVLDDDPVLRVRWQADTRKRYLDEAVRREAFRRDFVRAHG